MQRCTVNLALACQLSNGHLVLGILKNCGSMGLLFYTEKVQG